MIERATIENIINVSGLPSNASDEQIRAVLLEAQFSDNDVDAALALLRNTASVKYQRERGLHKILRTNDVLKPAEISALLGVDMTVSDVVIQEHRHPTTNLVLLVVSVVVTLLIAGLSMLGAMYYNKVGMFHETATASTR